MIAPEFISAQVSPEPHPRSFEDDVQRATAGRPISARLRAELNHIMRMIDLEAAVQRRVTPDMARAVLLIEQYMLQIDDVLGPPVDRSAEYEARLASCTGAGARSEPGPSRAERWSRERCFAALASWSGLG